MEHITSRALSRPEVDYNLDIRALDVDKGYGGTKASLEIDALWHRGVRDIALPITAETVWRALKAAQENPPRG